MIIRVVSYSSIGSYKNPIWHFDGVSEIFDNSKNLHPINQDTLIPYETLDSQLISQIQNLNLKTKKKLKLQMGLDQLEDLNQIVSLGLTIQVWVDQKLTAQQLQQLKNVEKNIELIFVPIGEFDYANELILTLQNENFVCNLLLAQKKSLHDSLPHPEDFYHVLSSIPVQGLILKKQFESMPVDLQNLFLNPRLENLVRYTKNKDLIAKTLHQTGQGLNWISGNYFSYLLMTLIKPTSPVIIPAVKGDVRRFLTWVYHQSYRILLSLSWPLRKVYWILKYQFEKRILGHHK